MESRDFFMRGYYSRGDLRNIPHPKQNSEHTAIRSQATCSSHATQKNSLSRSIGDRKEGNSLQFLVEDFEEVERASQV